MSADEFARDQTANNVERYLQAATRDNTQRSYQGAIQHFEVQWGGFLPATADSIARYLADHADVLALSTLKQRMAALAQWHNDQGFPDPTKAPIVKKVLKGIRELHPTQEKRARPLQLDQLTQLMNWIETSLQIAEQTGDKGAQLTHARNRALVLVGFWRGFRSDELSRLNVENIHVIPGEGMTIYLPRSKGDRLNRGSTYKAPVLRRLCPVGAYQDWIALAGIDSGPVFRGINRWGHLADAPLNPNSIIAMLRRLFIAANLPEPESYSSHSLRRGFATWANANQWDVKALMEYVGWKDVKSALRYIDSADPYGQYRIDSALGIEPENSSRPISRMEITSTSSNI